MTSADGDATVNAEASTARNQRPANRVIAASALSRAVLAMVWPPLLVAWVYLAVGRLGFYPTDEGLNQAYSYRILLGQVPHRDFISPRPLGSALLHLVDFAIPGPLFEVSRVIAMIEYAMYAMLFAWLIYNLAPWRWGVLAAMAAAASALVNLNSFPLMGWYTADGLLLVAGGYVLIARGVERQSARAVATGFLLLGMAALTKQSFAPAPVFGWILLVPWLQDLAWPARLRSLISTGLLAAFPSLVFVTTISLLGGFAALRTQLLGNGLVYGRSLLAAWSPRHDLYALGALVALAAILMTIVQLSRSKPALTFGALSVVPHVLVTVLIIAIPLSARLGLDSNDWGIRVLWIVVVTVAAVSIKARRLDLVGVAVLGAAWMASLSYGYAWPNLVGGSMVLYVLHRTWSGVGLADLLPGRLRMVPIAIGMIAVVTVGYVFDTTRQQVVYLDRPAVQLTASLRNASPAFGDIRTNSLTAVYLTQMAECVRMYPARQVAILPENAGMYVALSLHNPFPIDWMWPGDFNGSEARILATTDRLNRDGDYLVLFQTVGEPELVSGSSIPAATLGSQIHAYTPIPTEIYDRLTGQRTICGAFLVVYAPARA